MSRHDKRYRSEDISPPVIRKVKVLCYRLTCYFQTKSDLVCRNWEIATKMVPKILLMLPIYFGQKWTVCLEPLGPWIGIKDQLADLSRPIVLFSLLLFLKIVIYKMYQLRRFSLSNLALAGNHFLKLWGCVLKMPPWTSWALLSTRYSSQALMKRCFTESWALSLKD